MKRNMRMYKIWEQINLFHSTKKKKILIFYKTSKCACKIRHKLFINVIKLNFQRQTSKPVLANYGPKNILSRLLWFEQYFGPSLAPTCVHVHKKRQIRKILKFWKKKKAKACESYHWWLLLVFEKGTTDLKLLKM